MEKINKIRVGLFLLGIAIGIVIGVIGMRF